MKNLDDIKALEEEKKALQKQLNNVERQLRTAKGIACDCDSQYTFGNDNVCGNCGGKIYRSMNYTIPFNE